MNDVLDAGTAADVRYDTRRALAQVEQDLHHFGVRAQAGEVNASLVHALFRNVHNLKSLLALLREPEAAQLTHEIESHFDRLRDGAPALPEATLVHCREGVALMQERLEGAPPEGLATLARTLRTALPGAGDDGTAAPRPPSFHLEPEAAERLRAARAAGRPVYQIDKVIRTDIGRRTFQQLPVYEDVAEVGTLIAVHPQHEHLPRHTNETVLHILFAARAPEDELALRIFDPYRPVAEPEPREGPSAEPAPGAEPVTEASPLRILIVEDDFVSRFTLREMLADHGACDVAVNGREAVSAFELRAQKEEPYDLVCLDIMMPEMDGHETIKHLRALEEEQGIRGLDCTCVIMTTALSDAKHVMAAFDQQADAYLVKPIDFDALLAQMQTLGLIA